jgi:hypothetical protein
MKDPWDQCRGAGKLRALVRCGQGAPLRSVALVLCTTLAAHVTGCGQTIRGDERQATDTSDGEPPDAGDRGGSTSAAPDAISGAGHGGASGSGPGPAPVSGAGSPDALETGTRFCEDTRECAGLECRTWSGSGVALCVRPCDTTGQCKEGELCLEAVALEPACVQRCEWPSDCLSGFDCFDWYRTGDYACVPALWVKFLSSP